MKILIMCVCDNVYIIHLFYGYTIVVVNIITKCYGYAIVVVLATILRNKGYIAIVEPG